MPNIKALSQPIIIKAQPLNSQPLMPRWFNTAGPCLPSLHYMLPALDRLPNLDRLVEQQGYFVLHAPRQTGKTTAMLAFAEQLTQSGRYTAILLSVEVGQPFSEDIDRGEKAILQEWREAAEVYLPEALQPPPWKTSEVGARIGSALATWAKASPRPLVLLLDEIDSLAGSLLMSVLRQIRSGYPRRPQGFPQSLALIGLRDVRDYKIVSGGSERLNTASPFNIKVSSFGLRDFTPVEVVQLYQQHTHATGQIFTDAALQTVFEITQGQPWLVNAIAKAMTETWAPDAKPTIDVPEVQTAKEQLIQRRETHLDSLAERLQDDRIRQIIEPMIAGQTLGSIPDDDVEFVINLGLIKRNALGVLEVSNPIYREVIPRVLANRTQERLPMLQPNWLTATGELDPTKLLDEFLKFWRQHGQPLLKGVTYHEIAPHIVMMAFLHRVVNGEGSLEREYAIGTDRMDLCLRYRAITVAIELKVWRKNEADPAKVGLKQLDHYLAGLGLETGWLVIFDQRSNSSKIADRMTAKATTTTTGRTVQVIRV
jgi:hypothetical protein